MGDDEVFKKKDADEIEAAGFGLADPRPPPSGGIPDEAVRLGMFLVILFSPNVVAGLIALAMGLRALAPGSALLAALAAGLLWPFQAIPGLYLVTLPLAALAASAVPVARSLPALPPRTVTGLSIDDAGIEIVRIRHRRGLRVTLSCRALGMTGDTLDMIVRIRPGDPLGPARIPALLRRYRDEYGVPMTRARSARLGSRHVRVPRFQAFLPLRAIGVPAGTPRVVLRAEIVVTSTSGPRAEKELAVVWDTAPEDFDAPLVAAEAVGMECSAFSRPDDASCPICGDRLDGPVTTCEGCATPHHRECWIWAGGCGTYACDRAVRSEGESEG